MFSEGLGLLRKAASVSRFDLEVICGMVSGFNCPYSMVNCCV